MSGASVRALVTASALCAVIAQVGLAQYEAATCPLPGISLPSIDGSVPGALPGAGTCSNDVFWNETPTFAMVPTGSLPNPLLRIALTRSTGPATGHVYVGIVVDGETELSDLDQVWLLFQRRADGSTTWKTGDFILRVRPRPGSGGAPVSYTSGELCNIDGQVEYYEYNGTEFVRITTPAVPAATIAKFGHDHHVGETPGDLETNVWSVEVDVPIRPAAASAYYDLAETAPYFAMGVYMDINKARSDASIGAARRWPSGMDARGYDSFWDVSTGLPLPTRLAYADLANVCYDVRLPTTNAWVINSSPANSYDNLINRCTTNTFRVNVQYDGPGTSPGTQANTGTLRLSLTPYAAGPGPAWVKDTLITLTQYNQTEAKPVDFILNLSNANRPTGWPDCNQVSFLCATMTLSGFQHDQVASNNSKNVNYNEFATNDYRHQFAVSGDSIPGLGPGQEGRLILRFDSRNDPLSQTMGSFGGGVRGWPSEDGAVIAWLMFVLAAVLTALVAMRARAAKHPAFLATAVAGVSIVLVACPFPRRPSPVRTERWAVTNARDLGLRPVPNEHGTYSMPIRRGETRHVELQFLGRPLPYRTESSRLGVADPTGQPQIIRVPVQQGQIVTALAFGEIDLDGGGPLPSVAAGGLTLRDSVGLVPGGPTTPLMPSRRYASHEYGGALVASFDDFQNTGFVVGRGASFAIPGGVSSVSFAVNARPVDRGTAKGSYDLRWAVTEIPRVPSYLGGRRPDISDGMPWMFDIYDILTSLNVYTYYETEHIGGNGMRMVTRNPYGAVHYSIYATREQ